MLQNVDVNKRRVIKAHTARFKLRWVVVNLLRFAGVPVFVSL